MTLASALTIALLIHSVKRFQGALAVAFFLPYLASGVAAALVVRGVLDYFGPFNSLLRGTFGVDPDWLGNPVLAVVVISLMMAWKYSGYDALIFLAGLQSIPVELYEAADLDGASGFRLVRHIVLPLSLPVLLSSVIFSFNATLKVFDSVIALTNGGPGWSTSPLTLYMYKTTFLYQDYGYGSTLALLLTVICFLVTIVVFRFSRRDLTKG